MVVCHSDLQPGLPGPTAQPEAPRFFPTLGGGEVAGGELVPLTLPALASLKAGTALCCRPPSPPPPAPLTSSGLRHRRRDNRVADISALKVVGMAATPLSRPAKCF